MTPLEGIVPVLISPLDEHGNPDGNGINTLVAHIIDNGAGGIWLLGSTGEDINLLPRHRQTIIRLVAEANKGRIPIITGTGCGTVSEALEFMDEMGDVDVAGMHLLFFDHKQSDASVIKQMTHLADQSPHPVWLYHNPKRGKPLSAAVIKELRNHENIVGMKLGGYSLTEMINAVLLARDDFQVMGAAASQFFTMLGLGCTAHTASEACSRTALFTDLYETFKRGDLEGAREKQFDIIRLNQTFLRTAFQDNGESSAEEKYVLKLMGICQDYVSPAYRMLNDAEKASIEKGLKEFSLL